MNRHPDGKRLTSGIRLVFFITAATAIAIGMNFVLLDHAANPGEPVGVLAPRLAGHDGYVPQAAAASHPVETVTTEAATKSPRRETRPGSGIAHRASGRIGVAATAISDSGPKAPATTEEPNVARADDRATATQAQSSPSRAGTVEPAGQAGEAAGATQRPTHEVDRQEQELQKRKKELEKALDKANREHDRALEKKLQQQRKDLEKKLQAQKQEREQAARERESAERAQERAEKPLGADDDD